jgi:hypothetical protein
VTYFKSDEAVASPGPDAFVAWLSERGITPPDDPAELVAAAQSRFKPAFDAWLARFVD